MNFLFSWEKYVWATESTKYKKRGKRYKLYRSHNSIRKKRAEKVYNFHGYNVRSGALFVRGKIGPYSRSGSQFFLERKSVGESCKKTARSQVSIEVILDLMFLIKG